MERIVNIDGREYRMRASALIPRLYRAKFNRDIFIDIVNLQKALKEKSEGKEFSYDTLTIFEDMAWLFIKNAGEDIPETPDAWLDSIENMTTIYELLPVVLELWTNGEKTLSESKKKIEQQQENSQ